METGNAAWTARINHLMQLKPGWDGFSAEPVTRPALGKCLQILGDFTALPDAAWNRSLFIAPLEDGGLELDWNLQSENDLILTIPPAGDPARFLRTVIDPLGEGSERTGLLDADDTLANLFSIPTMQKKPKPPR